MQPWSFSLNVTGLQRLVLLNLEGCPVTAACLEHLSGLLFLLVK